MINIRTMPPKKPIPIIEHESFSQTGEFSDNDFKTLIVSTFDEAATLQEGWTDEPLMLIGMELSQDLLHVDNARTLLYGKVFKTESKTIAAKKLWNSNTMQLKVHELDLTAFKFKEDLTSELLDHGEINHKFIDKNDGLEVPEDVRADLGCTGFSMRATLVPTGPEKADLLLVVYPLPAEDLKNDQTASTDARFPGILVAKEPVTIGLKTTTVTESEIPSPVCPVFVAQTATIDDDAHFPPTAEIMAKMLALLRKVAIPETKIDHAAVWRRWAEIRANGENNLKTTAPAALWPEVQMPDPDTGRSVLLIHN